MKNKKGFTLVELIVMIAPNVIKNYNKSKIDAINIQENKLVASGVESCTTCPPGSYCTGGSNIETCPNYTHNSDGTLTLTLIIDFCIINKPVVNIGRWIEVEKTITLTDLR